MKHIPVTIRKVCLLHTLKKYQNIHSLTCVDTYTMYIKNITYL